MSEQNKLGQTIIPKPFITRDLAGNNWNQLRFRSENELVTFRYLASKLIFTDEPWTVEDGVAFFLAYELCVKKAAAHPEYRQKYWFYIHMFRIVVQNLDEIHRRIDDFRRTSAKQYASSFGYGRNFLSKRYYYSIRGQMIKQYHVWIQTRFPKRFPPKAYVGKGYGDQGTAKDVALDGSLSWKETYLGVRNLKGDKDEPTLIDKEMEYFAKLKVTHPSYFRF